MSNWDYVFRYDERAADWLAEQEYAHPAVLSGNQAPSRDEVLQAWAESGLDDAGILRIDCTERLWNDDGCFRLNGEMAAELWLLRRLSEKCGQLWLYPDTGSPAIVMDAVLSPERVAAAWLTACDAGDSWAVFHDAVYGAERTDLHPLTGEFLS